MLNMVRELLAPAGRRFEGPSSAFPPDSAVTVQSWIWEVGEITLDAVVIRPTSDTHLLVRLADNMMAVVPAADCTLKTGEPS